MYRPLCKSKFKGVVLFLCVPWVLIGCGDFDADGADKSGSLFNIEEIDPTYFAESTRQVDVVMVVCSVTEPGEPPDVEPYTDHFADVRLSNRPLNNSAVETGSTIYVDSYQLRYQAVTLGSPVLPSSNVIPIGEVYGLEQCAPGGGCTGETISQIDFVPVREKEVLYDYLFGAGGTCDGSPGQVCQLKYNIYYTFFGENDYGYEVSANGSTFFYASNYDNCGG
jgi:hypothetical protein